MLTGVPRDELLVNQAPVKCVFSGAEHIVLELSECDINGGSIQLSCLVGTSGHARMAQRIFTLSTAVC